MIVGGSNYHERKQRCYAKKYWCLDLGYLVDTWSCIGKDFAYIAWSIRILTWFGPKNSNRIQMIIIKYKLTMLVV
jgi:hypothetical protein